MKEVSDYPMETVFLFQRISNAIRRGNSISFHDAFQTNSHNNSLTHMIAVFTQI